MPLPELFEGQNYKPRTLGSASSQCSFCFLLLDLPCTEDKKKDQESPGEKKIQERQHKQDKEMLEHIMAVTSDGFHSRKNA